MYTTQEFKCNGALVRVKRANKRIDAFDAAIYSHKLFGLYAVDISVLAQMMDIQGDDMTYKTENLIRPEIQTALTIISEIQRFCDSIAPRIQEFFSDALPTWPRSRDSAEAIDIAFRLWLGDETLQKAIEGACKMLDNPNGTTLGVVSEVEANDPLSVRNGVTPATP